MSQLPPFPFLGFAILAACVSVGLSGCFGSDGLRRNHVKGQVTFEGEPVPRGVIRFIPDREEGNSGPGAIATIENGHYKTASGRGVVSGPHVVMISGFDGIEAVEGAWEGQPLFTPYTTTWDFPDKLSVVDFEVPANLKKSQ